MFSRGECVKTHVFSNFRTSKSRKWGRFWHTLPHLLRKNGVFVWRVCICVRPQMHTLHAKTCFLQKSCGKVCQNQQKHPPKQLKNTKKALKKGPQKAVRKRTGKNIEKGAQKAKVILQSRSIGSHGGSPSLRTSLPITLTRYTETFSARKALSVSPSVLQSSNPPIP